MTDNPTFEIFIPQSPIASVSPQDDQPPRLPGRPSNPGPQHGMVYDPTRGLAPIFPRSLWPWPHRNPRHLHHPNWTMSQPYPPQPYLAPSMQINPQLSINFKNPGNPNLYWDIIHPPRFYARVYDRTFYFRRLIKPHLKEFAIFPNVKKAWILSDHPVLGYWVDRWGPIVIRSENLLVEDVLDGIYEYLRTPLTPTDLSQIISVPGNAEALRYALDQRAKDSDEIEPVVIKLGYRRVDVVGGHRQFQGLQFLYLPDRTWRLRLSLLPGTLPKIY